MRRLDLACALACAVSFLAEAAPSRAAEPPKPKGDPAMPAFALSPDLAKRLKSADPNQVKNALDEARMAGRGAASVVPAIVERLKLGLPAPVTLAAIETLGDTENEGASEVLAWYAHDRTLSLRRAAVQALGRTKGAAAERALRAALSDSDDAVRGTAATALGGMKAKDALPDLFLALDHKVEEAAASIGQLCEPKDCERLADKLGHVPFDVMTGGLDQILLRPVKDIDEETKIKIVGKVRELGTAEANGFLKDVQTKWPPKTSPRVKQAIDQAVIATSASPGSRSAAPEGGAQ